MTSLRAPRTDIEEHGQGDRAESNEGRDTGILASFCAPTSPFQTSLHRLNFCRMSLHPYMRIGKPPSHSHRRRLQDSKAGPSGAEKA